MRLVLGKKQKNNMDGSVNEEISKRRKSKVLLMIFSVVVAMLLWLLVVDPVQTTTISIPVQVNGLLDNSFIDGKDIMVTDSQIPQRVNLTIRGRESYLNKVNRQVFATVVDFTTVEDASQTSIQLSAPIYNGTDELQGIRTIGMDPATVTVKMVEVGGNTLPLYINTTGKPADDYEIIEMKAVPDVIRLTGNKDIMSRAEKAVAYVDVTDLSANLQKQVEVELLDKNGDVLVSEDNKYYADVTVTVGKRVPIVPTIVGKPNERYSFRKKRVSTSPKYIVVTGNSQELRNLKEIPTTEIDISTFDRTMIFDVDLMLPGGIEVADGTTTVEVTIPIKNVEIKTFSMSKENIRLLNVPDGYRCEIISFPNGVTITGTAAVLKELNAKDVLLNIDLSNVEEGESDFGLVADTTKFDIRLVGDYKAKVKVSR